MRDIHSEPRKRLRIDASDSTTNPHNYLIRASACGWRNRSYYLLIIIETVLFLTSMTSTLPYHEGHAAITCTPVDYNC